MNDELKTLLALMNGEISPAQAMTQGGGTQLPSNGGQQSAGEASTLINPGGPQAPEVEITPDMKAQNPVVNKARGRNKITGVADFFSNPEVQNALISFGQAFSNAGNYSGQQNPIDVIGNTAREGLTGQANQRALKAFESGEDIAEAAGRFADPEVVSQLQDRKQQQEQFEEELKISRERLGLEEEALRRNTIIDVAKLTNSKKLAEAEIENEKKLTDIRQQEVDARKAYWESLRNKGDNENLSLRANEYFQVLSDHSRALDTKINNTIDALEAIDVDISEEQVRQLKNGIIDISDVDISAADNSNWPFGWFSDEPKQKARNLLSQLGTYIKAKQTVETEASALRGSQTERLTGKSTKDISKERQANLPGGINNPLPVSDPEQAMKQEEGTYVNYGGVIYEILPNGRRREIRRER